MAKVLTIGSGMLDFFLSLKPELLPCTESKESSQTFMLLEVGRKLEIPDIHRCSGGGATNAAVSFSRQGFTTSTFFKIGADCEGDFIKKQLAADHVDTGACITSPRSPTGLSIIFPCPEGDRTTITYRGASITLEERELPTKLLHSVDLVYITSLSGQTAPLLLPIARIAHQHGVRVAVNPGSSQLRAGAKDLQDALAHIDILIMNSFEAHECIHSFLTTGTQAKKPVIEKDGPDLLRTPLILGGKELNLRQFFSEALARGPQIAVVTNGKEGVYVAQNNDLYFHPSLPGDVVSTLGAGDAFGSGFVGGLLAQLSLQEALLRGLVQASSVISTLDTKQGLLKDSELKKRIRPLDRSRVQHFIL